MSGWVIPPPSQSVKSDEDLPRERETKIAALLNDAPGNDQIEALAGRVSTALT
jgi:hypothetical protein